MRQLRSIVEEFTCRAGCRACDGEGTVCEAHPNLPWFPLVAWGCQCGAPGMPCLLRGGVEKP